MIGSVAVTLAPHSPVAVTIVQSESRPARGRMLSVVVFSEADRRTLRTQIRNFRRMVVWDPAHEPYKKMLFGVSCGLATIPIDGKNVEQVMHCADRRMYATKTRFKQFADRIMADCLT